MGRKPILSFLLATSILFGLASCKKSTSTTENTPEPVVPVTSPPSTTAPVFTGPSTTAANLTIRVIYLVPSDRKLNQAYTDAVGVSSSRLATWYKSALGGNKTFHLNTKITETIQSTHAAAWFNANNGNSGTDAQFYFYTNARNDVRAILGSGYDESKYIYMVYVDAAGTTGAGAIGFTAMPENDLLGLTNQMPQPWARWVGGAGHEIGHAFGLPHPANQDPNALMWTGYTLYPNCILNDSDKATLNANKFFY
ncbi:zinc metalloprotease [Mucilaginibacter myungsuensis]|uniref:Dual-action HEIGH metallo-peptidase n=1 Tax=Mucilaginibacter myungsuensis TaxID=649104 RepID=A0A929L3F6_9SPHI|nr:hypothetical protein [Mucilaginibacter myungsuensis]MBE9663345.1 hypothetical protein [Mucilaginibacter myungsuensis]MDN3600080.1 hypothetical protein [Mucilaginibacter myungsuensis]